MRRNLVFFSPPRQCGVATVRVSIVVSPGDEFMKASDLFIEALQSEAVEFIFGFPGEENLDFLDSLS